MKFIASLIVVLFIGSTILARDKNQRYISVGMLSTYNLSIEDNMNTDFTSKYGFSFGGDVSLYLNRVQLSLSYVYFWKN